ncbi:MAG: hypothetical protein WCI72_06595, partial [archaeon]
SYSANVSYAFANNEYHTFNLDVSTFGDLEGISIAPLIKGSKKCGVVSSVNTIPNCNLADVLVLRPNGQPCDSSDKCISGYCGYSDNSLGNRVCTAGITDESNCDSGEQCQDRYCDTLNSICSDGIDGSGCSASYDCQSGSCDGSYCYTRQNTYVALGGSCDDSYVFCTEGSCIEGICRVTCSANADCNDNGGYCNTYNSYWNSFSNFCTNGALGVQCAASNQCESWLVCGSITYSCAFSCADNSECASGSHCHSEDSRIAYCTPNGWWPSNSVDCSDNNDCSSGFKCVDTNCVPGIPTCSSNEDCQSNGGYCSGISHLCTQGITGIDSCNNLDQCAAWQCGSNNKCGSLLGGSCGTNENDCQEGTCNGESCV